MKSLDQSEATSESGRGFRSVEVKRNRRVGSWWRNLATDEIGWSDAVFEIVGVSRNELRPTLEAFRSMVHPDDRAEIRAWCDSAIASGTPLDFEHRILRPDGEVRYVRERGDLVAMKAIGAKVLIGSIEDVTEGRRLQEAAAGASDPVRRLGNSITSIKLYAESARMLRDAGGPNRDAIDSALENVTVAADDAADSVRALRRTRPRPK